MIVAAIPEIVIAYDGGGGHPDRGKALNYSLKLFKYRRMGSQVYARQYWTPFFFSGGGFAVKYPL